MGKARADRNSKEGDEMGRQERKKHQMFFAKQLPFLVRKSLSWRHFPRSRIYVLLLRRDKTIGNEAHGLILVG